MPSQLVVGSLLALAVALLGGACGGAPRGATADAEARFARATDEFLAEHFRFRPGSGVELGLHEHDGRVPDRSTAAIAAEIERLHAALATFAAFSPDTLAPLAGREREVLLAEIRTQLVELELRRVPFTNPMFYATGLDLAPYITRPYRPLPDRVRAMVNLARGAAGYFAQARENLEPRLPRTFIETARLQVKGAIDFVNGDVRKATAGLDDAALAADLAAALDGFAAELARFDELLGARLTDASDGYSLGKAAFLRMLVDTQGIALNAEQLIRLAEVDLLRNLNAMEEAARTIDPARTTQAVVASVAEEKPAPTEVIALATAQTAAMKAFVEQRKIATIPTTDVAEVRESPAFMRWNSAFLDSPGAFETAPLPAFYYITPPDPTWPDAEQRAYVPPVADLLYTTIHEVWPGHFLHGLHIRRNPSRVLKSFCTYSMVEGWAHYTEEMMWDEGATGADPRLHVGQLKEALLRNVRFIVALGLHTGTMTVDEAARLFEERAYADPATARQQAVRGTFDPMYVSYTLGKLAIRKLRNDWKAKVGDRFTLAAFHDEFLSHACAPLPVIRRAMLGDNAGPTL